MLKLNVDHSVGGRGCKRRAAATRGAQRADKNDVGDSCFCRLDRCHPTPGPWLTILRARSRQHCSACTKPGIIDRSMTTATTVFTAQLSLSGYSDNRGFLSLLVIIKPSIALFNNVSLRMDDDASIPWTKQPDVFKKLKGRDDKFKECLTRDVEALLGLYEAAHLRVRGEDVLDELVTFTTAQLNSALPDLGDALAGKVIHALNQPIRTGLTRLEARSYISLFEPKGHDDKLLLDFAKLDFNLLQKLHQRELSEITRFFSYATIYQA